MSKTIIRRMAILLTLIILFVTCIGTYYKVSGAEEISSEEIAGEEIEENAISESVISLEESAEEKELMQSAEAETVVLMEEEDILYSGTDDTVNWEYDPQTYTLTFSGTGTIQYKSQDEAWNYFRQEIQNLIIEEGITGIEKWAFEYLQLNSVILPKSLNPIDISISAFGSSWGDDMADEEGLVVVNGILIAADSDKLEAYLNSHDDTFYIGSNINIIRSSCISSSLIRRFSVDPNNQYYASYDGVLFTKDLSEMIKYPLSSEKTSFVIPDETKIIPETFWYYADEISSLYIGKNIGIDQLSRGWGSDVADTCRLNYNLSNLESISVSPENEYFTVSNGSLYSKDETVLYYCPRSEESVVIGSSVTNIAYAALNNCDNLTSLELPESVETIEPLAFAYCDNLASVTFKKNMKKISYSAFRYCPRMQEMYFEGNAPEMALMFNNPSLEVTGYYPKNNATWTDQIRSQNYGANISWVAIEIEPDSHKDGWEKDANGIWHYYSDGAAATGWQKVGSTWYLFNNDGDMLTGWQQVSGVWYYLASSGAMVTGWQQVGGTWYYFKDSGAMVTGWQQVGGTWYYFKDSGAMVTGWQKVGSTWYYFKSSGAMAASEWCEGYWLNADGSWTYQPKGRWKQDSTGWWFGDTSGWYAKNTTVKIDNVNYKFNASGYWVK